MAFPNFLDQMFPQDPSFGGGMNPDLTMSITGRVSPELEATIPLANPQKKQGGSKLRDFIGLLGDAFLARDGRAPIYRPIMQERQQRERLAPIMQNYLADPQGAINALLSEGDIETASVLMKMGQKDTPAFAQELQAFGIDPRSEEGQQILRNRYGREASSGTTFTKDLDALGIDPRSDEARELFYGRNSPAGYLLRPPARGGSDNVPTVNTQEEYDALPPGARYRDSQGNPGVKRGGATGSAPSQVFR